ncbi:glycoside hydrolase [Pelagicoccus mobilis]|uniref:Uncharacterized protein n=1 Tax=Pelagicoccus mobilis TaxID=415221 RepID=A0A934S176_9BACT|nr:glycoside hydrolase [Pelagicoccus mobilis]MBK1878716.1 hypothetical protein [Pelagicoccus mobilis]
MRRSLWITASLGTLVLGLISCLPVASAAVSQRIEVSDVADERRALVATADETRTFTWWLPTDADSYVLPIAAGIEVDSDDTEMMGLLERRSPWHLKELPVLGARYGDRMLVAIAPWPHYADLVFEGGNVGVEFRFPKDRNNVTPCELVVQWVEPDPIAPARAFRAWRDEAEDIGGLGRLRSLTQKIDEFQKVDRLLGAPHFYLWGPAMFSKHDVPRSKWVPLAKALNGASESSFRGKLRAQFSDEQRSALAELAGSDWPANYLLPLVAGGMEAALRSRDLANLPATATDAEVVSKNRDAIAKDLESFVRNKNRWGDGLSTVLLDELKGAGIEHAVLTLSDLYGAAVRPDVSAHAEELEYLIGPYDSYHSVHSPDAGPDDTWETAQFDEHAFVAGRVVKEAGRRQGGFKGRGYHFSPEAAWPYVQDRVGRVLSNNGYSSWFIDCDATAECFDDYNPLHPATRVDDMNVRRDRLRWLEKEKQLVVGSEGGSSLYTDVIHFGHGVHTPYIGHLFKGFRDREGEFYLGRHWPPDMPEQSFKAINAPQELLSPYFDPSVRVPLYQAAVGDELVTTHHWSFDSLKFSNIKGTRALLEILYRVPPMYHLNRESWETRKGAILHHVAFWSPLHAAVAEAPLVRFERLSEDGLVQRATYATREGDVVVTVNFGEKRWKAYPEQSATVVGVDALEGEVYRVFGD